MRAHVGVPGWLDRGSGCRARLGRVACVRTSRRRTGISWPRRPHVGVPQRLSRGPIAPLLDRDPGASPAGSGPGPQRGMARQLTAQLAGEVEQLADQLIGRGAIHGTGMPQPASRLNPPGRADPVPAHLVVHRVGARSRRGTAQDKW
jgi:hypothetical protein